MTSCLTNNSGSWRDLIQAGWSGLAQAGRPSLFLTKHQEGHFISPGYFLKYWKYFNMEQFNNDNCFDDFNLEWLYNTPLPQEPSFLVFTFFKNFSSFYIKYFLDVWASVFSSATM